jgi:hypothetical protein
VACCRLHRHRHAVQVDPQHAAPGVEIEVLQAALLGDKAAPGADAGVGKHAIQPAQAGHRVGYQALDLAAVADVGRGTVQRSVAQRVQPRHLRLQLRGVDVAHDDGGTGFQQHLRNGQAKAAGGASDDGGLPTQVEERQRAHGPLSIAACSGSRSLQPWLGSIM